MATELNSNGSIPFSSQCVENASGSSNSSDLNETKFDMSSMSLSLHGDNSQLPSRVETSDLSVDASVCDAPDESKSMQNEAAPGRGSAGGLDDTPNRRHENCDNSIIDLKEDDEETAAGGCAAKGDVDDSSSAKEKKPDAEKPKSSHNSSMPEKPNLYMEYTDKNGSYRTVIRGNLATSGNVQVGNYNVMTINNGIPVRGTSTNSYNGQGASGGGARGNTAPQSLASRGRVNTAPQATGSSTATPRKVVVPNRLVTSADLMTVAGQITKQWKAVGRCLGVPDNEMDIIRHDYERESIEEVAYQMLRNWSERAGTTATVQNLAIALQKSKLLSVVEKYLTTSNNS